MSSGGGDVGQSGSALSQAQYVLPAQVATDPPSLTTGRAAALSLTASGAQRTAPSADAQAAGLSSYRHTALLAVAQSVKGAPARLVWYHVQNPNTADAYLQIYDAAAAGVTPGTTTPLLTLWVPAGGALDGALPLPGLTLATALAIAATTTITGGTAPSTGLLVDLGYV